MKARQRVKLFIILGIEFIAIAVMLLLIFFAGKQVHTVTFDLNGGTLLSGDLVQKVTQGHNANPPTVTKEGCFFLKWSGSYREVTRDVVIEAIWEYETSAGIEYNMDENSNYCTISGCYDGLRGDIYIGAYSEGKKVLGIEDGAFENCTGITRIHLLDGILDIGANAFAGCTSLESIELPDTAVVLGDNVFKGCVNLKSVELPEDLKTLGKNAFAGCTALEEVTVYEGLEHIGANAFNGCAALETIALHEGLTYIGTGAFIGCSALTEITLPTTLITVESGVFNNADMTIYLCSYVEGQNYVPDTWAGDWKLNGKVEWKILELPEEETDEESSEKASDEEDE